MEQETLIPSNEKGKEVNLKAEEKCSSKIVATELRQLAAGRLMHPQEWHAICGSASASFTVLNASLEEVTREIEQGDYIRIDIPGPGPSAGDGYDWVQVAVVEKKNDGEDPFVGIKLMPCSNPTSEENAPAHFFETGSSSTLTVTQQEAIVIATYHGRNEVINNSTGTLKDNIRNTVIAAGAMAGLSELQWTRLIHAFLKTDQ